MDAKKFWRELNDDYYKTFPQQWEEGDLYADGPDFVAILEGKTDTLRRRMTIDEKVTDDAIIRAGRKIWEIGRVYGVRSELFVEPALGQIRLVSIKATWTKDWVDLIFEVIRHE